MLRKATGFVFAVNEPAVNLDVEDASGPLDERWLNAEFVLDGGRQTGGFRVVVSLHAVGNGDVHGYLRPARWVRAVRGDHRQDGSARQRKLYASSGVPFRVRAALLCC